MRRPTHARSMDEHLHEFLDRWIVERTKLVKKYELKIEWWAKTYPDQPSLGTDARRLAHHQHELRMLHELRARSLDPSILSA